MMINLKKTALVLGTLVAALPAFAQDAAGNGSHGDLTFLGLMALGAGLAIGLAIFGAAGGQAKAAAAALEGIARNPSAAGGMFLTFILSLVLMESLGILAFLVSNNLTSNISAVITKAFGG